MQNLQDTIALLTRTPAALNSLLRDLPDTWTQRNEGQGTWSVCEVVAHLIYGEQADWIPRAKIILQFGETRPFESFDRAGHLSAMQGKSLAQLLDGFAAARSKSLAELRAFNLQPQDLQRRGRHPAFGPVTLSQHLAAWVGHDLTHVHQVSRVLAHQYREAVGPFHAYLGVLQCAGHSAPA